MINNDNVHEFIFIIISLSIYYPISNIKHVLLIQPFSRKLKFSKIKILEKAKQLVICLAVVIWLPLGGECPECSVAGGYPGLAKVLRGCQSPHRTGAPLGGQGASKPEGPGALHGGRRK